MAAASTVAAFLSAFRTSLAARFAAHGTLSAVTVDLVPTGDTSSIDNVTLIAGKLEGEQTYHTMSVREDSFTIPGSFLTKATGPDTNATFQAAMDRAGLILDELIFEIRDNEPAVGINTVAALITETNYKPWPAESGGWFCECDFVIEYQARVS